MDLARVSEGVYQEGRGNSKQPARGRGIEKQMYIRGNWTLRGGM